MNEFVNAMQRKQKQAEKITEEQRGDGKQARSSRQLSEGSEGGEGEEKLRWRVHLLEKEKLEMTSSHNQEVRGSRTMHLITSTKMSACRLTNTHCVWYQLCKLRAELTRLRSSVERGEAQRVELQYQLTVSQRNEEQVFKLTGKQIMCTFSSMFFFFLFPWFTSIVCVRASSWTPADGPGASEGSGDHPPGQGGGSACTATGDGGTRRSDPELLLRKPATAAAASGNTQWH